MLELKIPTCFDKAEKLVLEYLDIYRVHCATDIELYARAYIELRQRTLQHEHEIEIQWWWWKRKEMKSVSLQGRALGNCSEIAFLNKSTLHLHHIVLNLLNDELLFCLKILSLVKNCRKWLQFPHLQSKTSLTFISQIPFLLPNTISHSPKAKKIHFSCLAISPVYAWVRIIVSPGSWKFPKFLYLPSFR